MTTNDPKPEEGTDSIQIFLEAYTYIGEDAEGMHHHACSKTERVIVADDHGRQGGRHDFWMFIDAESVSRIEPDLWSADDLEAWADFVEDRRGWTDRALYTAPQMRKQFMEGQR